MMELNIDKIDKNELNTIDKIENNENIDNLYTNLNHLTLNTLNTSNINTYDIKLNNKSSLVSYNNKTCLIIYTGGTFGMAPDKNGTLFPTNGFLEKKINEMDEFQSITMPKVHIIEWEEPIDSSDMEPCDWKYLANQIKDNYIHYDGFVILQGTDTMAYTASALSFMLENLNKPVIMSGAMIPLHYPHSDARRNLIMSVLCAGTLNIPEVCIYSNDKLLRGNRTTKIANMTVDAFHSPNHTPLASTGVETIVDYKSILPFPTNPFEIFTDFQVNISVFRLIPGFDDEFIKSYLINYNKNVTNDNYTNIPKNAIVFALYGTGNGPLRKERFLNILKDVLNAGIIIVICTQCLVGRTQLNSYATGIKLLNMGVISSFDMTMEACVTKLAYLMGKKLTIIELKEKMETNLRGELTNLDIINNERKIYSRENIMKNILHNNIH